MLRVDSVEQNSLNIYSLRDIEGLSIDEVHRLMKGIICYAIGVHYKKFASLKFSVPLCLCGSL